ncbi:MAG: ATP-grasp domain-containing protein [Nevskiaceae bacterium]|nr:MAG: ATP-grasp domain-containing protein [Nevskiaceae bacterium]TBR74335.1 MAG: ATP-grasp domain-containing protein [Nevskiaceae bacterium]
MHRILVANRGEIARRVIATARRMGLETVAVYSAADAATPHVREATASHALGGNTSAESYLRVDKLLAAARATGADAIHPGYGFLSEDAAFAQAVQDAGLTWIGPPPAATRALGNKAHAKRLAIQHGVPCLPGYNGDDQSPERLIAEAEKIGYPVMVKAVAGGGGRGMRLVTKAADLPAALKSASSEALSGFGNGDLLIERAVQTPRHVEVQVFADAHGHAVHLGERDCSMQRRHQKIIEETPSPAVTPELRERMGACAVALTLAAGYVGAGTVEFLLEGTEFFLMEMNTRLQVEHTITEQVTGLDLVEWQIRVARGEVLPLAQEAIHFHGHAIEVRLCAEDENYVPRTGRIAALATPPVAHFERAPRRFDAFIEPGTEITPYYDSLLGKLVVHEATREAAIDAMLAMLAQTAVLGLPTNRAFLMECLADERFRRGDALISFLDEHADEIRTRLFDKQKARHVRWSAAIAHPPAAGALPCPFAVPLRLAHRDEVETVSVRARAGSLDIVGEPERSIAVSRSADGALVCTEEGVAHRIQAVQLPGIGSATPWHAQADGVDWWFNDLSFVPAAAAGKGAAETELRAPFNGRVVAVDVHPGDALEKGTQAIVIESMKLEHALAPRTAVTVAEVLVEAGQQVTPGQVLMRFGQGRGAGIERSGSDIGERGCSGGITVTPTFHKA